MSRSAKWVTVHAVHVIVYLLMYTGWGVQARSEVFIDAWRLLDEGKIQQSSQRAVEIVQAQRTDRNAIKGFVEFATKMHDMSQFAEAKTLYTTASKLNLEGGLARAVVMNNLGRVLFELGEYNKALETLENYARSAPEYNESVPWHLELFANLWNNIGLSQHRKGACCQEDAIQSFLKAKAFGLKQLDAELYFNLGVSSKQLGKFGEALELYEKSLEADPKFTVALMNLAALYHEHQVFPQAVERYKTVIEQTEQSSQIRLMALANLGVAYTEMGDAENGIRYFRQVLDERASDDSYDLQMKAHILVAKRVICDWTDFDAEVAWLRENVELRELSHGKPPSLLPFDTLLMPLDPAFRLRIAVTYAAQYGPIARNHPYPKTKQIKVGYLSYDYSDHPTAHLCEDLFNVHTEFDRVESHTLSYGKDDGSVFRKRIEKAGHKFHELALMSHKETIRYIQDLEIEILVDMQGFTRGGRAEVTGAKPAPISINYLVFAGTSGAKFIDYFISDRYVSPLAEYAQYFSEKLVLMPNCYQVNTYSRHVDECANAETQDIDEQLRGASFVFANFNKNDKLEPTSFGVWMEILKKVPGSVLWLLEPSRKLSPKHVRAALLFEAKSRGVDERRILFAPRVSKAQHIERHKYADLFIDTLIYGAHSTATDSLKGGLPVLTLAGDSFASRVGTSLLANVGMNYLITYSHTDFIDTAVRIATSHGLATKIKAELRGKIENADLFNLNTYTVALEYAYQAMSTVREFRGTPAHIIISRH
mmetsp:Transcript_21874/g.35228  ORF Transcript_21874/g.35228 Transcript_21874/m.35228 type:complete len:764 (+) Transcript_21874:286-2577(+)